jgi:hypothetical protein
LGDPPMLGSPLAPARGTELLAHLHRSKDFVGHKISQNDGVQQHHNETEDRMDDLWIITNLDC